MQCSHTVGFNERRLSLTLEEGGMLAEKGLYCQWAKHGNIFLIFPLFNLICSKIYTSTKKRKKKDPKNQELLMKKKPIFAQNYSTTASSWFWILHRKHKQHLLPLHPTGFIIACATWLLAGHWRVWTRVVEKVSLGREAVQV